MRSAYSTVAGLCPLAGVTVGASFPPTPEGRTVVNSTNFPGASVSWKETHICETTDAPKSYAGHIRLPPNPDSGRRNYPINTFFWFFSARNDPDNVPFSIWLQGGPGVPSVSAALGEHGPCRVNIDGQTTSLNPWSWNDRVNMLYIDQPVQVGFSYDVLTNGTIDEIKSPFAVTPFEDDVPETNLTTLTGTFASQDPASAPNTTDMSAVAMWEFMQVFTEAFEPYQPVDNKVSIWAASYGGHYAPTYAAYFQMQNAAIDDGDLDALKLNLDTVGLINACVDMETQMPFYPQMAYSNTYGIQAITEEEYQESLDAWPQCKNLTQTCRSMAEEMDPEGYGNNTDVNEACYYAFDWCFSRIQFPYMRSGLYQFDIMETLPSSFPPKLAAGYLNQANIQQALGVPLNLTGLSAAIGVGYNVSGDFVKGKNLAHLGQLLADGVKVALVYGDADYQCKWYGGEALSLAIDADLQASFAEAGYNDIQTNDTYVGGSVRQHGNLTYSRVYNAGHEGELTLVSSGVRENANWCFAVPWYQPETAYQIFNRVMFNKDVASGTVDVSDDYSSSGAASIADVTNESDPGHERYCYLWDMLETCVEEEYVMVMSGAAIIKDYILLGYTAENGTNVYLLNGTTVGEQLMGDGGSGNGNGSANGSTSTSSPAEQTSTPTGNGATPTGMINHAVVGLLISLLILTVV